MRRGPSQRTRPNYPSDTSKRPREKQHKQTENKYKRLRGETDPIVGGSLEELERRLDSIEKAIKGYPFFD